MQVELEDRRSFDAKIVGSDRRAISLCSRSRRPACRSCRSVTPERCSVGDIVLALGNPLGVGQTVTMGIISAKGRATGLGDGSFEDFLQTDAPINSGNSGGALVNTRGELVGINSQILSPSGGNIGIGFSIPVNMARAVMDALIKDGQVHRGRLGCHRAADHVGSCAQPAAEGNRRRAHQRRAGAKAPPIARAAARDVVVALNGARSADSNELRNGSRSSARARTSS